MERMKRSDFLLKRLFLFLFWPLAALLGLFSLWFPNFAEWYARHPYRWLSLAGNRLTALMPFSLAEVLLYLLLAGAAAGLAVWGIRLIKSKRRGFFLYRSAVNLICASGIVFFFFTAACGVNYHRYSFSQTCGLAIQPSSAAELNGLCRQLALEVNTLRETLHVDENEVMALRFANTQEAGEAARLAFEKLSEQYPTLPGGYSAPKPVLGSRAMSACRITGIFIPFTFEANVNTDVPDYSLPVTMCHELSHLRGFMREDEANFIGYLACRNSGDPDLEYSGNMLAFTYATNALASADPKACQQIFDSLDKGVLLDLQKNSEYWARFEGPVAKAADVVNDTYLKANRQKDGVKSYGRMVDLLLAEYRAKSN